MLGRLLDDNRRYLANATQWAFYAAVMLVAAWAGLSAGNGENLPILLAVGLVGALLCVHEPALALAGVFVAFTFGAYSTLRLPGLKITAPKLMVMASFGAWAARSILSRGDFLRVMPVTPAYFVVAGGIIVTSQASLAPGRGTTELATLVQLLLMNHLLYTAVTPRRFVLLMNVAAFSGVVALLLGAIAGFGETRSSGLVRNSNEWAWVSLMLAFTTLGWFLSWRHPLRGLVLGLTMVLLPLNLVQSASRAGILGFLVTLPLALVLLRKERWLLTWVVPVGIAALAFFATQATLAQERFDAMLSGDRSDGSMNIRRELLDYGLQLFWEQPVLGIGPGMVPTYNAVLFPLDDMHPFHNSYLTLAVEQGLVGIACHGVLWGVLAVTLWRGITRARTLRIRQTGMGIAIGLVGFCVTMIAGDGVMAYAMAHFLLGLGLVVERMSRETDALPDALLDPPDPARREADCASPS